MNWQQQRTMTPEDYVFVLKRLKLSQAAAGRYLGISARTSRRYANGDSMIPVSQVLLLRALLAGGWAPVVPRWHRGQN